MRLKNILDKQFPIFARMPALYVIGIDFLTYYGTRPLLSGRESYELPLSIDGMIPLVPAFVVIYFLAYVQWVHGIVYLARAGRERYYHIVTSTIIALLICMVAFLAFPVTIARPEITGDGIFERLTAFMYASDTPQNLFPSLHCLLSWTVFRGSLYVKREPKWRKFAQLIMTLLVFASTLFVKQHYFVDILAAIIAVEIGYFLSSRLRIWRVLEMVELPCVRRMRLEEPTQAE